MANDEYVRVKLSDIQAIASAIRTALGIDSTFKVSDMPALIAEIADTQGASINDIYSKVNTMNNIVSNNTIAINKAVTKFFEYNNPIAQTYELTGNTDKTFKQAANSLTLVVPTTVAHGYIAGANIVDLSSNTVVSITNSSSFDIKFIKNGVTIETITAGTTQAITEHIIENINRFVADCDGAYVYLYHTEVDDE